MEPLRGSERPRSPPVNLAPSEERRQVSRFQAFAQREATCRRSCANAQTPVQPCRRGCADAYRRHETLGGVAHLANCAPRLFVELLARPIARRDSPSRCAPGRSRAETFRDATRLTNPTPSLSESSRTWQFARRDFPRSGSSGKPRTESRCAVVPSRDRAATVGLAATFCAPRARPSPDCPPRARAQPERLIDRGAGGGAPLPVGWERVGEGPGERGQG